MVSCKVATPFYFTKHKIICRLTDHVTDRSTDHAMENGRSVTTCRVTDHVTNRRLLVKLISTEIATPAMQSLLVALAVQNTVKIDPDLDPIFSL